ncbi:unnamed protein product, partial [Trichobilharzia regenti]
NPFDCVQNKQNSNDPGANTLYSATDLFLFYKQILKQTLQLNRGRGLLGLVRLLRQYLSEYTVRVLLAQIPGLAINSNNGTSTGLGRGQTGIGAALENIKTQSKNTSTQSEVITSSSNQGVRLNKDDVYRVCVVLVTAAFCLKTVEDLEKRLKYEVCFDKRRIFFFSELFIHVLKMF